MDCNATHGPASCSSHADMGAQLTSLMHVGKTVQCGLAASPAVASSSPSEPCSRPSLPDKLPFLPTFLRRSVLIGGACKCGALVEAHRDAGAAEHENGAPHLASLVLRANLRSIPRVHTFGKLRLVGSYL